MPSLHQRLNPPRGGSLLRGAAAVACAVLSACAAPPAPIEVAQGLVLQGVTVVDTRHGQLAPRMNVLVHDGRIQRITAAPVQVRGTAELVRAEGQFVVPGYMDMHTHALPRAAAQPSLWPLLVAHGITGVREMAGSPELIRAARTLNAERAAHRVAAPEIVAVAGALFVGAPDEAVAAAQVRQHKAMGADFVKAIGGSREVSLAMLREARAQGLPVAGHLPIALTAEEAAAAGWRAVEHLGAGLGVLLDCAADPGAVRQAIARGEGARPPFTPQVIMSPMLFRALDAPLYSRVRQTYDEARCQRLAATFAQHGTWQVPTLIRVRTMMFSDDLAYRNDPALRYVDGATRRQWDALAQQYERIPAEAAQAFRDFYPLQRKLVAQFRQAGVKMLAGTDYGGIWVIPGASLHQEFAELAAAGLTPLDVLQMATRNAAEFLGRADLGAVEPGKRADLVLLSANPLQDVAHLGRIAGVVLNGRYLGAEQLARMKAEAADATR